MKIWKLIQPSLIFLDIPLPDKDKVLKFIANAFSETIPLPHPELLYISFREREHLMTTGIGGGIAIPHTFSPEVTDEMVLFLRLKNPIHFKSIDSKPVDIIAAMMGPENRNEMHLQILASIARLFRNQKFLTLFRICSSPDQLFQGIYSIEEEY